MRRLHAAYRPTRAAGERPYPRAVFRVARRAAALARAGSPRQFAAVHRAGKPSAKIVFVADRHWNLSEA
jgi:hypothetical protein